MINRQPDSNMVYVGQSPSSFLNLVYSFKEWALHFRITECFWTGSCSRKYRPHPCGQQNESEAGSSSWTGKNICSESPLKPTYSNKAGGRESFRPSLSDWHFIYCGINFSRPVLKKITGWTRTQSVRTESISGNGSCSPSLPTSYVLQFTSKMNNKLPKQFLQKETQKNPAGLREVDKKIS